MRQFDRLLDLPHRLREARERKGLTQAAAAMLIGVTPLTVCRWENGKCQPKGFIVRGQLESFLASKKIDRRGQHHQTTREVIDFVLQCLQAGCSADEAIAALERDGVLLDAALPTEKKEPIYSLCLRIVKTCALDPELAEYFATLRVAAQHTIDVIENRVPREKART